MKRTQGKQRGDWQNRTATVCCALLAFSCLFYWIDGLAGLPGIYHPAAALADMVFLLLCMLYLLIFQKYMRRSLRYALGISGALNFLTVAGGFLILLAAL